MSSIWFEDELALSTAEIDEVIKSSGSAAQPEVDPLQLRESARGLVRIHEPMWRLLAPEEHGPLMTGEGEARLLVRLTCEFEIPPSARERGTVFRSARCLAYLWPADGSQGMPQVYDVAPHDLYEGEQSTVQLKLSPSVKLDPVEVSLGEVSTNVAIGTVEPVIVGYLGDEARAPYWEIEPQHKPLRGMRTFWLFITLPQGCRGIQLAAMVDGQLQTRWGLFYVGPRERAWDGRYKFLIVR